jgi:hypothetical protein
LVAEAATLFAARPSSTSNKTIASLALTTSIFGRRAGDAACPYPSSPGRLTLSGRGRP